MKYKYFFSILVIGAVFDQFVKYMVSDHVSLGAGPVVIKGLFSITYTRNAGAAFGIFTGSNSTLMLVSICFLCIVLFYVLRHLEKEIFMQIAAALIAAGAFGNLIDRMLRGYVVDFFDLKFFSVFNTADIMINAGVVLIVLFYILKNRRLGS